MCMSVYVISLYHNHDLDNLIFDCLQKMICRLRMCMSLFMGELNGHHEWLGSTTTNLHGVPAFVFATVPGCHQLVVGQTHECGGTLDLLMFLT